MELAETTPAGRRDGSQVSPGHRAAAPRSKGTVAKSQANKVIREALSHFSDDEQISFFCECGRAECSQLVWLTRSDYDRTRARPEWFVLAPSHLTPATP